MISMVTSTILLLTNYLTNKLSQSTVFPGATNPLLPAFAPRGAVVPLRQTHLVGPPPHILRRLRRFSNRHTVASVSEWAIAAASAAEIAVVAAASVVAQEIELLVSIVPFFHVFHVESSSSLFSGCCCCCFTASSSSSSSDE